MRGTFQKTAFAGLMIIKPKVIEDKRGFFMEEYKKSDYSRIGIGEIVQISHSRSQKNVLRGMHFQIEVADLDGLYAAFKKDKYPIFFEMEEKWYRMEGVELGNRQFLVQDPDGYLLRFFQDLGKRG